MRFFFIFPLTFKFSRSYRVASKIPFLILNFEKATKINNENPLG